MTGPLTRAEMIADIAEVLEIDPAEVTATAETGAEEPVDLIDLGLDSVRLIALVERWQDRGAPADLVDFVADPDPAVWFRLAGVDPDPQR